MGPNSNGTSLRVRLMSAFAHLVKLGMNIQQTPMVPRNAHVSDRSLHSPHLAMWSTHEGFGRWPCDVHLWPTTVISSAHRTIYRPLKVPPQYLTHCTTQLTPWRCSQMNQQIPGFSGMHSSLPSLRMYLSTGPWIGTSLIYGTVVIGISGCKI